MLNLVGPASMNPGRELMAQIRDTRLARGEPDLRWIKMRAVGLS
jgi:hypothetical protein